MEYTKEQLKAAYALNLCTVSVSQIIDYDDINVMEQEYEAILNNLNLEEIPKDEALLKILKQILDTITFFRIEEGDKKFIEKEYQHKMKNAIWAAVPNIGMLVAGGNPVTMAVSLASQVGIGYMNYRKEKAENDLQYDKEKWELEKTAIEQFNGLRRELFDTAWRLADVYNFPDQLRLTERQIKQYNNILMDTDLLRRYARLEAVQDAFIAYPPFWYYFGNTANAISRADFKLSDESREVYREKAKEHFMQFRESSGYGILREDEVAASCALELVDLLDVNKDRELIATLLGDAVRTSGKSNDVMQIAAMTYLKLNDHKSAGILLNQLVNEQFNTSLNAQLLSSIFVSEYIKTESKDILARYEILKEQVGEDVIYPLPEPGNKDIEKLEDEFVKKQKEILLSDYLMVANLFYRKYEIEFGKIIPQPEEYVTYQDYFFLADEKAKKERKYQMQKVLANKESEAEYTYRIQRRGIDFALLDLLNRMFEATCMLDFMDTLAQNRIAKPIKQALETNQKTIMNLVDNIKNGDFHYITAEALIDMDFNVFAEDFIEAFTEEINKYVLTRNEMQDFAIAEDNLTEFCNKEGIEKPAERLIEGYLELHNKDVVPKRRFGSYLVTGETEEEEPDYSEEISDIIDKRKDTICLDAEVEFYNREDPRFRRYIEENKKLKNNNELQASILAVLDDKSKRGDYDLLFTKSGIVSVKNGTVRSMKPYSKIDFAEDRSKGLNIDGKFDNSYVNMENLMELIIALRPYCELEDTDEYRKPVHKLLIQFKK